MKHITITLKKLLFKLAGLISDKNFIKKNLRRLYIRYINEPKFRMNHSDAVIALYDAVNILDDLNFTYWLEGGSCLGAIREQDFLSHDKDIDFGIFARDLDKFDQLKEKFIEKGYELIIENGNIDFGYNFVFKKDTYLDFCAFYDSEKLDQLFHISWAKNSNDEPIAYKTHIPKKWFEQPQEISFLGIKTYVPNPPDEHLSFRYGNWKKPDRGYDWRHDSKPELIEVNLKQHGF